MTQPFFRRRDGCRRAACVAENERSKQHESPECNADEGEDAVDNFGARAGRRPRKLCEHVAMFVRQAEKIVTSITRRRFDHA